MITRIVTAVLALALFIPVLIFSYTWIYPAVIALLCVVGTYEMLGCTGVRRKLFVSVPSLLLAVMSPLLARALPGALYPLYLVFMIYFVFASVIFRPSADISELAKTAFIIAFVVFGFSSLVIVCDAAPLYYLLVFIAAWSTDTFAYFAGSLLGRHKLCPEISPKKTVEGAIGGVLGCVAVFLAFGAYRLWFNDLQPNWLLLALLAVPASVVSMLGDLSASVIKRSFGIKDYGNIFPGHGGVLDRFDSILPLGILAAAAIWVVGILW